MPLQLDKKTKRFITSLVLTPAYASIATGTSNKMTTNCSDSTERSITEKLFVAFHGDPNNSDKLSFVRSFCDMSGPFEPFLDKGYVSCVQETVIECLPSPTKSLLRLDLSQLLMFQEYFDLPRKLAMRLMRASLNEKNDNLVSRRTLKRYYDDNMRGVRKIMAYEKVFLDNNGDIPSGKTVNDLLGYIWGQAWEEHNELKMKKKIREEKKKKMDDSISQLDSDTADNDVDDINDKVEEGDDCDEATALPENYKCPDISLDGKWYPAGYPTYFCYVCPFTRVNDEYIHLFMGDGKQLDGSKAMNRKEERQKKMNKKNLQRDKNEWEKERTGQRVLHFTSSG